MCDVIGNVWQHTETPMNGFKGFAVHKYYDDFSVPTFDTRHNVIKGGSWISTGNEATRHARYAFRRHFYQHAGFRYVESEVEVDPPAPRAENFLADPSVAAMAESHYGPAHLDVPNFHRTLVEHAVTLLHARAEAEPEGKRCSNGTQGCVYAATEFRALDVGCGVGRATFELARHAKDVVGIDLTTRHLGVAFQMQEEGRLQFELPDEGDLTVYRQIDGDSLGLTQAVRSLPLFLQADVLNCPTHLSNRFSDFDLVLLNDVITDLISPRQLLSTVHSRLRCSGMLVVASSYDWKATDNIQRDAWLGGYRENGECIKSESGLQSLLQQNFTLVDSRDIPQVLRRSGRRFEYVQQHVTAWRMKSTCQCHRKDV